MIKLLTVSIILGVHRELSMILKEIRVITDKIKEIIFN